MRKPDKKEHLNLFFSAFLIIAYIICANFFANFAATMDSMTAQLISIGVNVLFGVLLFYATRVGDGKAVKRFSPLTLIILVLPTLFIIVGSLAEFMPLHDVFAADKLTGKLSVITMLSAVALGYGIPYSFFSGFEMAYDDAPVQDEEASGLLEGGVEADLLEDEEEAADEAEEAVLQDSEPEGNSDEEE